MQIQECADTKPSALTKQECNVAEKSREARRALQEKLPLQEGQGVLRGNMKFQRGAWKLLLTAQFTLGVRTQGIYQGSRKTEQ